MEANTRRRGVIKREQVEIDGSARRPQGAPAPADEAPRAPGARVRLLQLDEQTQAIEFTCSCGEVSLIEIQCEKKP